MCGRFTQRYTWREVHDLYDLTGAIRNLQAHYNIAPTDTVEVVRAADGATELVPMRWGLIPYWWKKPLKQLPATFNARAESVVKGKTLGRPEVDEAAILRSLHQALTCADGARREGRPAANCKAPIGRKTQSELGRPHPHATSIASRCCQDADTKSVGGQA